MPMRRSEIPVLVVGGGAAGTMLSLELARHGVAARTIDRLPAPARTSKAITVHARMAEIFERIDPRLARRFSDRAIHNKGYVLHFVDDAGRRSEVRPGIDFTAIDSHYPFILVIGQCDTENILRQYLQEEFGRATEWNVSCTAIEQAGDGVVATLQHCDGGLERVRCRYLVACDGMNSFVRRSLDVAQDESDYAGTKMQNMDVFLHDFPDAEDYVHYCAGTDHFIMIVKLPGGFYRLLLSDRGEAADPAVSPRQAFANLVDRHFDGVSLGEIVWHSKWESWVRLAHAYRDRNVFLAGDAAHVHSTTGGQGMNCCMQDAYNLGWKLGYVLRGIARPELLDTYERERRPIAEQVIWAASSLHDIFMAHGQSIDQRRRRMDDADYVDAVVGRCSGLSYTYHDTQAADAHAAPIPGPASGDRAIDVDLGDGSSLLRQSRTARFGLIGIHASRSDSGALTSRLEAIGRQYGEAIEVAVHGRTAGIAAQYGESSEDELLLVRPDGYIGRRCRGADLHPIEAYLAETLVPLRERSAGASG